MWTLSNKRNVMFKTRDEMSKFLDATKDKEKGLYFSLATYNKYGVSKKSNPALKGFRVTSNIVKFGSLFTEIDIRVDKDKKHYRSLKEASEAVTGFCKELKIPHPTMVLTGGGYHLYWTLQQDIDIKQWRNWSQMIIKAAECWGLLIDVAGTNKPTQIFRPVGTINHKYEPPFEVTLDGALRADVSYDVVVGAIARYLATHDIEVLARLPRTSTTITDADLRDFKPIVEQCEQIKTAPYGSEEHWRGMLMVARLCVDGVTHAHEQSALDERYDSADTDKKLYGISVQMEGTDGMPYTCEKFNEINPDVCQKCPHYQSIKSPIVLGIRDPALTEVPVTDVGELGKLQGEVRVPEKKSIEEVAFHTPEGGRFKVTEKGLVMKEAVEVDGEIEWDEVVICKQRLYPIGVILDTDDYGNRVFSYLWRIELEKGKENDAIIPADTFVSPAALMGVFASLGVNVIRSDHFKPFAQAMRAFITSVRDTIPPIMVHRSLGWKHEEFVVGTRTIDINGNIRRSVLNPEMETLVRDVLSEGGTLEGWKASIRPYVDRNMILEQVVLATAFAAPLINFSTVNGMIFSLQGESGCGKSTMQKVAASVWGNPSAQLQNSIGTKTGDTIISATRWIGGLNNLPVHLEELSNMSDQDASDLAYMITQGSEKNRMQGLKDGGFKRSVGLTWKTMVTTSTNEPICDKIARFKVDSHAELMRILEIRDIPPIKDEWYDVGNELEGVNEHYGHAGVIYASYLQANKRNLREWLNEEVKRINHDLETSSPERFWVQGVAAILLGAKLASHIGLLPFSLGAIRTYLYKQIAIHRIRTYDVASTRQSLFADMLNMLLSETLVVRSSEIKGTSFDIMRIPVTKLSVRIDISIGEMWISKSAIKDYSRRTKIPTEMILRNAKDNGFHVLDESFKCRMSSGCPELGESRLQTRALHLQIPNEKVEEIAN